MSIIASFKQKDYHQRLGVSPTDSRELIETHYKIRLSEIEKSQLSDNERLEMTRLINEAYTDLQKTFYKPSPTPSQLAECIEILRYGGNLYYEPTEIAQALSDLQTWDCLDAVIPGKDGSSVLGILTIHPYGVEMLRHHPTLLAQISTDALTKENEHGESALLNLTSYPAGISLLTNHATLREKITIDSLNRQCRDGGSPISQLLKTEQGRNLLLSDAALLHKINTNSLSYFTDNLEIFFAFSETETGKQLLIKQHFNDMLQQIFVTWIQDFKVFAPSLSALIEHPTQAKLILDWISESSFTQIHLSALFGSKDQLSVCHLLLLTTKGENLLSSLLKNNDLKKLMSIPSIELLTKNSLLSPAEANERIENCYDTFVKKIKQYLQQRGNMSPFDMFFFRPSNLGPLTKLSAAYDAGKINAKDCCEDMLQHINTSTLKDEAELAGALRLIGAHPEQSSQTLLNLNQSTNFQPP